MCAALQHRGPDDEGYFVDGNVGLGMRRLSIIDVAAGHQPMSNIQQTIWLVFNGEIYNHRAIRDELSRRGCVFKTLSDTETIVCAYQEYGLAFVDHLFGMFALALWDARTRQLVLVRDRLGKKPLYYVDNGKQFAFGSEIKSLLAANLVDRSIDPHALDEYLAFGSVGGDRSMFPNVRKLPPGHLLVVTPEQTRVQAYWSLTFRESASDPSDVLQAKLRAHLEEAVRCRLESEVPLGAFLSGGVDSSAVVGLASRMTRGRLKTFSIGFSEADFDEVRFARLAAERFGTEHHEFVVRPDLLDALPHLVRAFDEPFADSSMLPTYYLSKLAREYVTVAITGDGGDEVFGGYDRYLDALYPARFERWLSSVRRVLGPLARGFTGDFRGRRRLAALDLEPERAYVYRYAVFAWDRRARLYAPAMRDLLGEPAELALLARFDEVAELPLLSQMQSVDTRVYLPDDVLVKVDRMSMANSLECRAPLLDHRLVEFAATLPPDEKLKGGVSKAILKRTMADLIPSEILNRPKRGFAVPLVHWFRADTAQVLDELLQNSHLAASGYLSQAEIRRVLRQHRIGLIDNSHRLWSLLVLELWYRMYIQSSPQMLDPMYQNRPAATSMSTPAS